MNRSTIGTIGLAGSVTACPYLEVDRRRAGTKSRVDRLLRHFRETKLVEIDQVAIDDACRKMLRPDTGPAGKRSAVIVPMNAILEHAASRRMCERPNFKKPKVPSPTTPYLYPDQATALVRAAPLHLRPLLVFLAGVGCRPSEALILEWKSVDLKGAQATILLGKVNGKELITALCPVVIAALEALPHRDGRVFRTWLPGENGRADDELGPAYRDGATVGGPAFAGACARAGLPGAWKKRVDHAGHEHRWFVPEYSPYTLRHTFATWHYCVHKDLQRL